MLKCSIPELCTTKITGSEQALQYFGSVLFINEFTCTIKLPDSKRNKSSFLELLAPAEKTWQNVWYHLYSFGSWHFLENRNFWKPWNPIVLLGLLPLTILVKYEIIWNETVFKVGLKFWWNQRQTYWWKIMKFGANGMRPDETEPLRSAG